MIFTSILIQEIKAYLPGKLTSLNKASFVLQLTSAAVVLTASAMLVKAAYQDLYKDIGFDAGNVLIVRASFLEDKRGFSGTNTRNCSR